MNDLPTDAATLTALIFLLGARHGLDVDHLAAIDGLTRLNLEPRPRLARACGALFALGHGTVFLAAAGAVALLDLHIAAPPWLQAVGTWISIVFLAGVGLANLRALRAAPAGARVGLVGFKGRWLGGRRPARQAAAVFLVGALFAFALDTLTQAALLGIVASAHGGVPAALGFGIVFAAGMLLVDGLQGRWFCRLLGSTAAPALSRLLSAAVAAFSLLLATAGAFRELAPAAGAVGAWPLLAVVSAGLAAGATLISWRACIRAAPARVVQG